jgi:PAS domain S-box-containing protein
MYPSFSQLRLKSFSPSTRRWLCIFLLLLCCAGELVAQATATDRPSPQILILHSYHVGYVWSDDITEGIRSTFRESGLVVHPHLEYLDVRRHPGPEHLPLLHDYYKQKFKDLRFDVIICADNAALEFLLKYHEELFPQTPVVFCGVEAMERYHLSGEPLFTGVMEVTEHVPTLALALKLHPNTRRAVCITDYRPTLEAARSGTSHLHKAFPQLEFVFIDPESLTLADLLERVKTFPADSSIGLLDTLFRNRFGETFSDAEATRLISQNCPFPVYGVQTNTFGHGIVGGKLNSGFFHGAEAARRALAVVRGQRPADLPISPESPNHFQFDYVQLNRWRINQSLLPPDSIIANRPISLYSQFKRVIWFVLGFFAFQSVVISVLLLNIRRRKKAESSLRQSEASLEKAQNIAHIGSWEHDLANRQLRWSNETYRIFGCSQERPTVSLDFFIERVHPDDREAVMRAGEKARASGKPYRAEHRIIRPDGSERLVQQQAEVITDHLGTAVRMVGTTQDITDVRHLEEQLRQSQKMEAIGRLAGGIAHDFNNLLTGIIGYSDLLLNSLDPNEPSRQDLEEIKKAGERAASLTSQLLAFSRKQILQPSVLDLNKVIADLDKMLRRLIGEDIELVTLFGSELGHVKVDPGQIEQIIMNLAVNARDAMPQGGQLTIETNNVELDEAYARRHVAVAAGYYVMLAVSDTGCGMDAETQSRIFEPFFTTKEAGKGTGLGLSTVYGIVKQSGGNIWVYSELGQGTTFKVYLPHVDKPAEQMETRPSIAGMLRSSETILVVEDEEAVRKLTCQVLRMNGYQVVEAPNSSEAPLISERYEGPIHLLLTDVVMPQMSGREVATRLASMRPTMKVLYMSGYTDDAIVHHGVLDPGVAFIQKPFTPAKLARKVREVLDIVPAARSIFWLLMMTSKSAVCSAECSKALGTKCSKQPTASRPSTECTRKRRIFSSSTWSCPSRRVWKRFDA